MFEPFGIYAMFSIERTEFPVELAASSFSSVWCPLPYTVLLTIVSDDELAAKKRCSGWSSIGKISAGLAKIDPDIWTILMFMTHEMARLVRAAEALDVFRNSHFIGKSLMDLSLAF